MNKISYNDFAKFAVYHYQSGEHKYQRLGQAFINYFSSLQPQHFGIAVLALDDPELFFAKDPQVAMEIIMAHYVDTTNQNGD
jgi:hypothetical protein